MRYFTPFLLLLLLVAVLFRVEFFFTIFYLLIAIRVLATLWMRRAVPQPLRGSAHGFKYRLAYVADGVCVLRYDNEAGKGDHKHFGDVETAYVFSGPETLLADFWKDVTRWNDENRNS